MIDYDELLESINENSLETYQNMHKSNKKIKNKLNKAQKEFGEFEKI